MTLRFLIEDAFDLPAFQVSMPDSIGYHHFDIAATSGAPVSRADMRAMLKSLLVERFHLATHWETRTDSSYRLEVLPSGVRMTPLDNGYAMPNSPLNTGRGVMQLNGPMSMRQLAERLAPFTGKPVIDATNLDGFFKVMLNFTPDNPAVESDGSAPLLPKAVQEQLGLRLVVSKEPIKVLVVDHVDDQPTPN